MSRKMFKTGVLGGIVTAICCFTPILVIIFSAVGLAAAIKYLDFVLFPMLQCLSYWQSSASSNYGMSKGKRKIERKSAKSHQQLLALFRL